MEVTLGGLQTEALLTQRLSDKIIKFRHQLWSTNRKQ